MVFAMFFFFFFKQKTAYEMRISDWSSDVCSSDLVVALRDSTIIRLPVATFNWLLDNSIPFNRYLLHQLNERVGQFIGKAEHDRLLAPDARVARCLAELFNPLLYPDRKSTRLNSSH